MSARKRPGPLEDDTASPTTQHTTGQLSLSDLRERKAVLQKENHDLNERKAFLQEQAEARKKADLPKEIDDLEKRNAILQKEVQDLEESMASNQRNVNDERENDSPTKSLETTQKALQKEKQNQESLAEQVDYEELQGYNITWGPEIYDDISE